MRRHAAAVLLALAAAMSVIGTHASSVAAECMYLPPWPRHNRRDPDGSADRRWSRSSMPLRRTCTLAPTRALASTHSASRTFCAVERGPATCWTSSTCCPTGPRHVTWAVRDERPSCTYLRAAPGEVIALAFDALQPGGPMTRTARMDPAADALQRGRRPQRPGRQAGTESVRERVTLRNSSTWHPFHSPMPTLSPCRALTDRSSLSSPLPSALASCSENSRSRDGVGGWRRAASGGGSARRSSPERPEAGRRPATGPAGLRPPRDPHVVDLDLDQAVRRAIDRHEVDADRLAGPRVERGVDGLPDAVDVGWPCRSA